MSIVNVNLPCEDTGGLDPNIYATKAELVNYVKYVIITREEYESLLVKDPDLFYMIPEED